jgi:hypothetical protein
MSGHRAEAFELYGNFFNFYESTTYGVGVFNHFSVNDNHYMDDVKNLGSLPSTTISDIVVLCTR